tara:strand:- start:30 stop:317 length:288 start_codon:yes stop_codon:yes gene_type:complete
MPRYKILNGVRLELTDAEETARNAEETAANNNAFDRTMILVRDKRNALLKETDFYALSDVTMSSDMTTYRQNLRDITNGIDTVDKANNITWPTKP